MPAKFSSREYLAFLEKKQANKTCEKQNTVNTKIKTNLQAEKYRTNIYPVQLLFFQLNKLPKYRTGFPV